MKIGDIYISSAIKNPASAFDSRITIISFNDKGAQFRREHPYHETNSKKGEMFLDFATLDKSLWKKIDKE